MARPPARPAGTLRWADLGWTESLDSGTLIQPWNRLPREAVESPSLEIFQTRLDAVLCSLLWVTLLGQGVGLGDPQRALPTPNIL